MRTMTIESFREDLEHIIHLNEMDKDAPDFILAQYLLDCLAAYEKAVWAKLYFDTNEKIQGARHLAAPFVGAQ